MDNEQQRLDAMQGPGRLWIPQTKEKEIVYIDDDPCCIYEHNPKIGGNYRNEATCLQGVSEDVVCCQVLGPNSRYYVGYLTVVDCSQWTDGKGNEHQYEMRLMGAKMRSLKLLRRRKDDDGTLIGKMFTHHRTDEKSASIGDDIAFKRDVNLDKMFPVVCYRGKKLADLWREAEEDPAKMLKITNTFNIKPGEDGKLPRVIPAFNYFEVLKPRAPQELRLTLGGVEPDEDDRKSSYGGGGGGGAAQAVKQDDVPF